jgi:hypothetical protein
MLSRQHTNALPGKLDYNVYKELTNYSHKKGPPDIVKVMVDLCLVILNPIASSFMARKNIVVFIFHFSYRKVLEKM